MNRPLMLMLSASLACSAATAQTQSWDYKAYTRDRTTGQYDKQRFVTATVSITQKDGQALFRMITPGRGDPCTSRSDLPAEVQRDTETTTVTVTPPLAGCEPFRYVIRNDGSGGVRQHLRNAQWVDDGFDHGLTSTK